MTDAPAPSAEELQWLLQDAGREGHRARLLRDALDRLCALSPVELAAVFLLQDDRLVAAAARGSRARELSEMSLDVGRVDLMRRVLRGEVVELGGGPSTSRDRLSLPRAIRPRWDELVLALPLAAGPRVLGCLLTLSPPGEAGDDRAAERRRTAHLAVADLIAGALDAERRCAILATATADGIHRMATLEDALIGDPVAPFAGSGCEAVQQAAQRAEQASLTDGPVVIEGEPGVGKDRLALAIHRWGRRGSGPFVLHHAGGQNEQEAADALFGRYSDRAPRFRGALRRASGGTLCLHDITALPSATQRALALYVAGGEPPLLGPGERRPDTRVIATSRRPLGEAVSRGELDPVLANRLDVMRVALPPLRERIGDLRWLCEVLLTELGDRTGRRGVACTDDALEQLRTRRWPTNLSGLGLALEAALLKLPEHHMWISPAELTPAASHPDGPTITLTLDEVQRRHIAETLARTGGRLYGSGGAAELLGMKPTTLQSRMKKLGVARTPTSPRDKS